MRGVVFLKAVYSAFEPDGDYYKENGAGEHRFASQWRRDEQQGLLIFDVHRDFDDTLDLHMPARVRKNAEEVWNEAVDEVY